MSSSVYSPGFYRPPSSFRRIHILRRRVIQAFDLLFELLWISWYFASWVLKLMFFFVGFYCIFSLLFLAILVVEVFPPLHQIRSGVILKVLQVKLVIWFIIFSEISSCASSFKSPKRLSRKDQGSLDIFRYFLALKGTDNFWGT